MFLNRLLDYIEDRKIGEMSLAGWRRTYYRDKGSNATQSTDYRVLREVFARVPLTESDVLCDVGCGFGRVLSYVTLSGSRAKVFGIELDPLVAITAAKRMKDCPLVEVLCGDACELLPEETTVIYMYNPFQEEKLHEFLGVIESGINHPLTVIYVNDYYSHDITERKNWQEISRGNVRQRTYRRDHPRRMPYGIFRFTP
ncbi:MAG: class I SAM-dependent methyltransferase [Eubacterium sp.]|nr:class I SAM-dependent methyltransferase [Eubacterium sp.]